MIAIRELPKVYKDKVKELNNKKESSLIPVSEESLAIFRSRRGEIVVETTRRALAFEDEVAQHGGEAETLISTGLDFTTRAIETAMQYSDTAVLAHQISWGFERLQHDGVLPSHVLHRLEILEEVISTLFPKQHSQEINQFVRWMITEQERGMADDE